MDFFSPKSISEALSLLTRYEGARCLAGGATLVAMLNAGLVEPPCLVSLAELHELAGITAMPDGSVRIGAMTRHVETAGSTVFSAGQRVLSLAAGKIANVPVRNMGTIGGSLGFADPAADYLPALAALDAAVEVTSASGTRCIKVSELVTDWYTTSLEPAEMITAVLVPPAPANSIGIFEKLERTAGDFAIASVALVLATDRGFCSAAHLAIGACAAGPIRLRNAEARLEGTALDEAAIRDAGRLLADIADPIDDVRASANYRRLVIPRLLAKAIASARPSGERA
jgi:aerobic carbon-monoxide dehydrogenase medium subunit